MKYEEIKLEDMSDFELNCKLADCLGLHWSATPEQSGNGWGYSRAWDAKKAANLNDYCTDWNVTMPLAVEHGVSMTGNHDGTFDVWTLGDSCFIEETKSPLRAIVICLIKVLSK